MRVMVFPEGGSCCRRCESGTGAPIIAHHARVAAVTGRQFSDEVEIEAADVGISEPQIAADNFDEFRT